MGQQRSNTVLFSTGGIKSLNTVNICKPHGDFTTYMLSRLPDALQESWLFSGMSYAFAEEAAFHAVPFARCLARELAMFWYVVYAFAEEADSQNPQKGEFAFKIKSHMVTSFCSTAGHDTCFLRQP